MVKLTSYIYQTIISDWTTTWTYSLHIPYPMRENVTYTTPVVINARVCSVNPAWNSLHPTSHAPSTSDRGMTGHVCIVLVLGLAFIIHVCSYHQLGMRITAPHYNLGGRILGVCCLRVGVMFINSLVPETCCSNVKSIYFKLIIVNSSLCIRWEIARGECHRISLMVRGNGLVPSGNKPLPELCWLWSISPYGVNHYLNHCWLRSVSLYVVTKGHNEVL